MSCVKYTSLKHSSFKNVCVREREREKEGEKRGEREMCLLKPFTGSQTFLCNLSFTANVVMFLPSQASIKERFHVIKARFIETSKK